MKLGDAACCLESLGNDTRLSIFRTLVRCGPEGLPVGQLQTRLKIPGSTLSHHIARLVKHDLVLQSREGRVLRCTANYARMNQLLNFLTKECCVDAGGCN